MEDGLGLYYDLTGDVGRLNPCFNGRWSRTSDKAALLNYFNVLILVLMEDGLGLSQACIFLTRLVLILVLMEDGLGQCGNCHIDGDRGVLILVLMEDGLGQQLQDPYGRTGCLNPCFNGRWSRTLIYGTEIQFEES